MLVSLFSFDHYFCVTPITPPNIEVNYQGERPYSITMTAADRQALASVYELAQLLSSMTEIKKNMETTEKRRLCH